MDLIESFQHLNNQYSKKIKTIKYTEGEKVIIEKEGVKDICELIIGNNELEYNNIEKSHRNSFIVNKKLELAGEIKKDERIDREKRIIGFEFEGIKWQTEPKTAFYDWIYLKAVKSNIEDLNNTIYEKILNYTAFTDIEFNPKKSINCQARSCALYVSLFKNELLDIALESEEAFLEIIFNFITSINDSTGLGSVPYLSIKLLAN